MFQFPRVINANNKDVTDVTYEAFKKAINKLGDGDVTNIRKADTISLANNLVAYDLAKPALNLYPVLTPLRNRIPRQVRGTGAGDMAHWKAVTSIRAAGVKSMGWVPEGQRAGRMSITTVDKSATYVTLGQEADVTFEAQSAGQGFEDVMATTGMRLLQQTMILEEYGILGGNRTVALGTPVTPTASCAAGGGGTVPDATYKVIVVALTQEGYLAADIATGVVQVQAITGLDGQSYNLNGGSSQKSAQSSDVVCTNSDSVILASTTVIKGAVAYAWYVGVAGSEKLQVITTINSMRLTALTTTHQAASAITADCSLNAVLAFDGLMYASFAAAEAYYASLATGTPGVGTSFTTDGSNGVKEINVMLKDRWDNYRLSFEEIYVNAQELQSIASLVLQGSSTPLARFVFDVNMKDPKIVAGQTVGWYFNKFSMDGGQLIPIKLHPNLAPGTLFAWAQNLPAQYQAANVPNTAQVQCRRDYYQIPWPLVTRANQTGVYAEEVLKVLAPFALGIITNVAPLP